MTLEPSLIAKKITGKTKKHFLGQLSEEEFRDQVVMPLYSRMDLRRGRDLHGPDEDGKDCFFFRDSPYGSPAVIAIQTKATPITMSSDPTKSILTILTQVRTAFATAIPIDKHCNQKPQEVHVVTSCKVDKAARQHLIHNCESNNLTVLGDEEIISLVDKYFPEFWFGVDADRFPYIRGLIRYIESAPDTLAISDGMGASYNPVKDEAYIPLYVHHVAKTISKSRKHAKVEPQLVRVPVDRLVHQKGISSSNRILMLGDGGSGKSVALRRIAYKLAESALKGKEDAVVPVLLSAKAIGESSSRLSEHIYDKCLEVSQTSKSAITSKMLEDGQVVILIDSLDEASDDLRKVAISRILDFAGEFQKCTIILASREYRSVVGHEGLSGFSRYRMVPVQVKQAERAISIFAAGRSVDPGVVKELLRNLEDLHGLSMSPMMLTVLLTSADYSKNDLPANICEIFKKYTELMLGRWDEKKGVADQFHAPLKDFVLKKFAMDLHQERMTSVSTAVAKNFMMELLSERGMGRSESEDILDELLNRSGLLVERDGEIGFRHLLLQEFFAGRSIESIDFLKGRLREEWWRVAIVFYFGENASNSKGLCDLAHHVDHDILDAVDKYDAAIAVGLAGQASYLVRIVDRQNVFSTVVRCLSMAFLESAKRISDMRGHQGPGILDVMVSHCMARDAVATKGIGGIAVDANCDAELQQFWVLTGLLGSNQFESFCGRMANFKPEDSRLSFVLASSIQFVLHTRDVRSDDRECLESVLDDLKPSIESHMPEFAKEMKSMLLEWSRGEIKELTSTDEPEFEESDEHRG